MLGIDTTSTVASVYSSTAATAVSAVSETEESSSTATAQTPVYDTYTVSEEALAAMAAEESTEEVDTDTTVQDETGTDTDLDLDAQVEVEEEAELEEVEDLEEEAEVEEEVEEEEDLVPSIGTSYADIQDMDYRMLLMSSKMDTLTTMLSSLGNTASENLANLSSESWVNDASTFSYAGKYLAMSAAGTHGVQQSTSSTTEVEEEVAKEYFDYEENGSSTLSYDEILEKYETDSASGAFGAITGTSEE